MYFSVLTKAWYHGSLPHCSVAKIINYVIANKAGPTLVAMWQNPTASYSTCSPIMHQRAKCSRTTASEDDAPPAKSKHRIGYNSDWRATFSWHIPVYAEKGNPKSNVNGPGEVSLSKHGYKPGYSPLCKNFLARALGLLPPFFCIL